MTQLERLPIVLATLMLCAACANLPPGQGVRVQDRPLRMGPPARVGVDGPSGTTQPDVAVRPWTGPAAVVRTTAEVMAQAARTPAATRDVNRPRFRKIRPNRRGLPQNADALPDPRPRSTRTRSAAPRTGQALAAPVVDVATFADTASLPPDTMGDVGPTQYLVALNGRIRTISKASGAADGALDADSDVFFDGVRDGAGTSDPRVRYDRRTGRWVLLMINVALPNRTLVAVSNAGIIAGDTVWTFFHWTNTRTQGGVGGAPACLGDYPTLGLDEDALYVGVNQFCGVDPDALAFDSTSLYVINKAALLGGTLAVAQFDAVLPHTGSAGIFTPQGVDNFDSDTNAGYVVGVDNASFGRLVLRRVTDPATTPALSPDILVNVAPTALPINVPHLGGARPLDGLDDRLLQAAIRGGRLWTSHQIEVDANGAAASGGSRNGVRWYELTNLGSTPSVAQSGTVFDAAAAGPVSYFMSAIMPTGQGHVVLGMSQAGAAAPVNAAVAGRLASDVPGVMTAPFAFSHNTSFTYNVQSNGIQRWGDYSYTSVDPDDDQTAWTLQQYVNAQDSYAVRLAKVLAPPPAGVMSVSPATVAPGQSGVTVTVSGSAAGGRGFFDPGPAFARRPAVSLGAGVAVTNVTVVSPTSLVVTVNTTGAAPGPRTMVVTNPDGQTASLPAAFVVGDGTNQPPLFDGAIAAQAIFVASGTGASNPIAFMVGDPEGAAVTVTASSSNPAVVAPSDVVLGGTGLHRTVTLFGTGAFGSTTITLTASDGVLSSSTSFVATVTASAKPGPPLHLSAAVSGHMVTFAWQPPASAAGEPVTGYQLEASDGGGQVVASLPVGTVLTHTVSAPSGRFIVRVRAATLAGLGDASSDIEVVAGEAAPPLAPQGLLATVRDTAVTLQWPANAQGPVVAAYQLHAGSAPGQSDIAVVPLAADVRTFSATVPPGNYFVRLVAVNAAGMSGASHEVAITAGAGVCTIPAAPVGLVALGFPGALSVRWDLPQTGAIPESIVLQGGSASGASDLGSATVSGSTTAVFAAVPAGPYFLRAFAVNACGTSPASSEVSTLVP